MTISNRPPRPLATRTPPLPCIPNSAESCTRSTVLTPNVGTSFRTRGQPRAPRGHHARRHRACRHRWRRSRCCPARPHNTPEPSCGRCTTPMRNSAEPVLEERRGDHAPGEASEIVESAAVSTVHRRGDVRDRSPHVERRASDEKGESVVRLPDRTLVSRFLRVSRKSCEELRSYQKDYQLCSYCHESTVQQSTRIQLGRRARRVAL